MSLLPRRNTSRGLASVSQQALEAFGIHDTDKGIETNDRMETSAAGVYAAGDVVGGYQLAHVARYGGEVAEKNIMGKDDRAGAGDVPKCVYSFPEIASVGMDEQGCDKPENHLVPKAPFAANPKARCTDSLAGFTKIVIERKSRMIAGVHMFGEGAMAGDIKGMMHPHPSLSERSTDALAGIEE